MELKFDTCIGEVTIRTSMLNTGRHDLVEGVEVKVNGKLVGELRERSADEFEGLSDIEIEDFVLDHFDI